MLKATTNNARGTVSADFAESTVRELLAKAGIEVDGSRPHDIQVHDVRFFARVLREGTLGMGESYMDEWWDTPALDDCLTRLIRHRSDMMRHVGSSLKLILHALQFRLFNLQSWSRAFEVGERHYDVGNDLYRAMLDRRMAYTCAYWEEAKTLDEAQEAKLDLVCRKIGLKPGQTVLDLGCGWGSFAQFAAEKYGASVTGVTVSKEQVDLGKELCAGLPVEIRLQDYRTVNGQYDAVISIGIMEHVGPKNYDAYMDVVDRCLKPGGIAFIHTIARNLSSQTLDPWYHRYIFPNAVLPSIAQLGQALEERFVLEDLHNIGPHYDRTLMAWYDNFEAAWPSLRSKYGQRFYRMWKYYLLSAAAGFRARYTQLYQIVMTRIGTPQPDCRLR